MRNILFFSSLVEVFHWFATGTLMLHQVVIATGSNAFEFLFSEGEFKSDVSAGSGIVGQLVFGVNFFAEVFFGKANAGKPGFAGIDPFPVMLFLNVFIRLNEVFYFHLFKFTHTENKVFRGDFVAECFPNLCNTKRHHSTC